MAARSRARAAGARRESTRGGGTRRAARIGADTRLTKVGQDGGQGIHRRPSHQRGFQVLPERWIAERSLAWLSRPRRLAKDYEELSECAEAQVYLASVSLLLNRLAPRPC